MPAANSRIIVNGIQDAIQQSGGIGIYLSSSDREHPRIFSIQHLTDQFTVWVYIWTLTHGGRTSLPDEYRIQMTSVTSPLALNPRGYTVLMGFYPDLGMFAGFDLEQHHTFTPGSSSVQIDINTIHEALQNGLAFYTKTNLEIAIGIRPDQFINYIRNADSLHRNGSDIRTVQLLNRAVETQAITEQDMAGLSKERKTIVTTVSRYSRDANFRQQVLGAYNHRCAVTRSQLKLVDAAHIIPVPSESSIDIITNGIALSPTIHRAYDYALIYLDEQYLMHLNPEKLRDLRSENLTGGLDQLRNFLKGRIHLPPDRRQWPDPHFIVAANRYRRIPGYY